MPGGLKTLRSIEECANSAAAKQSLRSPGTSAEHRVVFAGGLGGDKRFSLISGQVLAGQRGWLMSMPPAWGGQLPKQPVWVFLQGSSCLGFVSGHLSLCSYSDLSFSILALPW